MKTPLPKFQPPPPPVVWEAAIYGTVSACSYYRSTTVASSVQVTAAATTAAATAATTAAVAAAKRIERLFVVRLLPPPPPPRMRIHTQQRTENADSRVVVSSEGQTARKLPIITWIFADTRILSSCPFYSPLANAPSSRRAPNRRGKAAKEPGKLLYWASYLINVYLYTHSTTNYLYFVNTLHNIKSKVYFLQFFIVYILLPWSAFLYPRLSY